MQTWIKGRCIRLKLPQPMKRTSTSYQELPQVDKECRPGKHANGLGQLVPAEQATVPNLMRNSLKMPQRQTMKHKQGKSGGKTPPKNELPGIRVQNPQDYRKSESR